ncbi:hypothetical protein [Vibrio ostreicida]|nr:hypothetical protein [Vibrio ostreicida]
MQSRTFEDSIITSSLEEEDDLRNWLVSTPNEMPSGDTPTESMGRSVQ